MSLGWFSKRPHFVPWMGKPCLCQYFNLLPCPYRCLCTWILLSQFQPTFVWYLMPVQGWGSGKQLPPMWFALKSWHQRNAIHGLSLLLVLYLAQKGFSLDTPVFPSPLKPYISKFQFDQDRCITTGCATSKSLYFIYSICLIPLFQGGNYVFMPLFKIYP